MDKLILTEYSPKSFVVRSGLESTKDHKDELIKLGGKWNPNLNGGGGYIFSNKHLDKVNEYLTSLNNPNKKGKFKIIEYKIYVPDLNEMGILKIKDLEVPIVVEEVNPKSLILKEESGESYEAIIMDGEWGIKSIKEDHSIIF